MKTTNCKVNGFPLYERGSFFSNYLFDTLSLTLIFGVYILFWNPGVEIC